MASNGRRLVLPIAWLAAASAASGQMSPPGFAPFKHVRVAADDGAPDGILRIAQTKDGYLWLAGDALYRFDGATFEQIDWSDRAKRRRASPSALMVDDRGELWVGMRDTGGVAVYRRGTLIDMHMPDPPRGIGAFAQTPDGAVWTSSLGLDKRLHRLRGTHWNEVGEALALPPGYIMDIVIARDGGLWVALSAATGDSGLLARLAPHGDRFETVPVRLSGRPKIALDPAGSLWVSDAGGTRRLFDAVRRPVVAGAVFPPVPGAVRAAFTFDRAGDVWGTTGANGIFYIANAEARRRRGLGLARFGAANGLTSDITYVPFVDREGNVWIGTEGGTDQFRRASAVQSTVIPSDPAHGLAIAGAGDGSVIRRCRRAGQDRPLVRLEGVGAPCRGDWTCVRVPHLSLADRSRPRSRP